MLEVVRSFQVVLTAILIYALVYATLKKTGVFDDEKVNSVIALASAIIVSLTGVVTFSVFYGVRLFAILLVIMFLIMVLLGFAGQDFPKNIISGNEKFGKAILGFLGVVFAIILINSFFALNNSEIEGDEEINTEPHFGVKFFGSGIDFDFDSETLSTFFFFLIIGVFVFVLNKN